MAQTPDQHDDEPLSAAARAFDEIAREHRRQQRFHRAAAKEAARRRDDVLAKAREWGIPIVIEQGTAEGGTAHD